MDKSKIMNELMEVSGSRYFCKKEDVCNYLGISINTAKKYVKGLEAVNGRLYQIEDVATRIISNVSNTMEEKYELEKNAER